MTKNSGYIEYIMDVLEPSGGITSARMFDGYAIRKHGLAIALIFEDEIYFKVDDSNRAEYEAMGSEPFTYDKKGKTVVISNWKVPPEILEDHEKLMDWTDKAYAVAVRAKKHK